MNATDFAFVQGLAQYRAGLLVLPEKKLYVESKLAALAKAEGLSGEDEVVLRARADENGDAAARLVEALLPDETSFFRDLPMFDHLATTVLPALVAARTAKRRLRVLCSGMGAGQEVYSVAMLLAEQAALLAGFSIDILGTDFSRRAVAQASGARYGQMEVQRGLSIQRILAHMTRVDDETWEIAPKLRATVSFRQGNALLASEPGPFDLILFRNVLPSAETAAKTAMMARIVDQLDAGGVLMLGMSETLIGLGPALAPAPGLRGFYVRAGVSLRAASPERVAQRA